MNIDLSTLELDMLDFLEAAVEAEDDAVAVSSICDLIFKLRWASE